MDQIQALKVFVRITELSSFGLAADDLGLPRASATTLIQQLEAQLGARLLQRTTRRLQLTPEGEQALAAARDLLARHEELNGLFRRLDQPLDGRLRVDMSSGLVANLLLPRLPEFLQQHPQLQIEISSNDRRINLIEEGMDCVVRVGTLQDSELIARPLGTMTLASVASPSYLQRFGTPQSLADLAQHRLVHYRQQGYRDEGWQYFDGQQYQTIPMAAAVTVNHVGSYLAACKAGLGIIQSPRVAMRPLLESGELVEILPQYQAQPMPVNLLYPQRRYLPQRVAVFMNWFAAVAAEYLEPI
jgi:DNA-binding transcriptional LysR family regulator